MTLKTAAVILSEAEDVVIGGSSSGGSHDRHRPSPRLRSQDERILPERDPDGLVAGCGSTEGCLPIGSNMNKTFHLGETIISAGDEMGNCFAYTRDCYCSHPTEEAAIDAVKEHLDRWGLQEFEI
jgi:hypothetical protein